MKQLTWIFLVVVSAFWLQACSQTQHQHSEQAQTTREVERVTIDQVLSRMENGQPILFIDSRNAQEWELADTKVPGALRVGNNKQLRQLIKEVPKDSFIVAYCT